MFAYATMLCAQNSLAPAAAFRDRRSPWNRRRYKRLWGRPRSGLLDGAVYRIDVPADWNHSLVVYYHGYQQSLGDLPHRGQAEPSRSIRCFSGITPSRRAATRSAVGPLQQGYPETEALRKYFVKKFGQPRDTYVVGGSLGGALVMVTLELNPKPYLGGLDLCAALWARRMRRLSGASRGARRSTSYFPERNAYAGACAPRLRGDAGIARQSDGQCDAREPHRSNAAMRSLTGLHTDAEVAHDMVYFTFVVADMQRRAGGNPFDNRNYLYTGTNPLSDRGRLRAQRRCATLCRRCARPATTCCTTSRRAGVWSGRCWRCIRLYDPLIPATTLSLYDHQVQMQGFGQNLVQQYVHRDGHCTFSPEEVGRAFDELVHVDPWRAAAGVRVCCGSPDDGYPPSPPFCCKVFSGLDLGLDLGVGMFGCQTATPGARAGRSSV